MNKQEVESYGKAGKISKEVSDYAKKVIKKGMKLIDIAEHIENKIKELGGEIAFPVNLSIDDVAAHYTPTLNDDKVALGLLKVDIGIHIKGFIADSAFTIDLTDKKEHKKLIETIEESLKQAILAVKSKKEKTQLREIGKEIHKAITNNGFSPIKNLSGHGLDEYDIHAPPIIPNYDNGNEQEIDEGAFAIEPFATYGRGEVYEAGKSNIYALIKEGPIRDLTARKIIEFVIENKKTLPFSEREIEKEFGIKTKFALKQLEQAGIVHSFSQLIEKSHKPVAQAEHSLIIYDDKVEVIS